MHALALVCVWCVRCVRCVCGGGGGGGWRRLRAYSLGFRSISARQTFSNSVNLWARLFVDAGLAVVHSLVVIILVVGGLQIVYSGDIANRVHACDCAQVLCGDSMSPETQTH